MLERYNGIFLPLSLVVTQKGKCMKIKLTLSLLAIIAIMSVSSCKSKQSCPAYGKATIENKNHKI